MFTYILSDYGAEARGDNLNQRQLQALEVCNFHIGKISQIELHKELIRDSISKSQRVVLSIDVAEISRPGAWDQIQALEGLYALSIRYRLNQAIDNKLQGFPVPGQEGDLECVKHYRDFVDRARAIPHPIEVIPEVEVNDHLILLGPTLMAFSRSQPPWMILTVDSAPTPTRVAALKSCFEYLQIRGFPSIDIHFSLDSEWARTWKAQSENFFSGPEEFHIDLSNKCTHSCVFCALYAPAIIEDLKSNNRLDESMRKFMSAQLDEQKALDFIKNLPITTRLIQFGGAGDPMLHPRAFELITLARERGIAVEILSNMEYFKAGQHEKLTALGGAQAYSLKFIANVSAASPETYVATRPRQKQETFHKVISNIKKLSELRKENGGIGAHVVIMCVINRLNFHEAPMLVDLAKEAGADLWFKPLELHSRFHYSLLPTSEEKPEYRASLVNALERADQVGVDIFEREFVENTLKGLGVGT